MQRGVKPSGFRWAIISLLTAAFLSSAPLVRSQGVVSFGQFTRGGGGGGTDQVQGWEFIPQMDVTVLSLGLYDGSISGGGFQESHQVAIWDGNGNLITSASIPLGTLAPLEDNFRYANITSVNLNAGQTYVIGAFMPTPVSDFTVLWPTSGLDPGIVSVDPRIQLTAYRFGFSPGGISFPQTRDPNFIGGFGPNFVIAVPEPGSFAFLSTAGGLWALHTRKKAPFRTPFVS
jgi:hypothetical protein